MIRHLKTVAVMIAFGFSYLSTAQESTSDSGGGGFEMGIQHSINWTSLLSNNEPTTLGNRIVETRSVFPRTTFDLGIFTTSYLNDKLSIDASAIYTYMGAHMETKTTVLHELGKFEGYENESVALDYVKIPVLLNFHMNPRAFVQFGGYGAFLISAETFYPWNFSKSRENLTGVNTFDAGIVGGVGFNTKICKLSLKYNLGLTDVLDEDPDRKFQNSVFQVVAQWKLYSDFR